MPKRGDVGPTPKGSCSRIKPRTEGRAVRGPTSTSGARRFYLPAVKTVNTDSSVIRTSVSQYTSHNKIAARYFARYFVKYFKVFRK